MKGMLALFIGSAAPWRWHFAEIRNWSSRTLALRQQLTTLQRMTKRLRLQTRNRLSWIAVAECGGIGARHWYSYSRTPSCGGIATGSAVGGSDVRNHDQTAVIDRSADRRTRPTDGGSEPAMGSPNSWRTPRARRRL